MVDVPRVRPVGQPSDCDGDMHLTQVRQDRFDWGTFWNPVDSDSLVKFAAREDIIIEADPLTSVLYDCCSNVTVPRTAPAAELPPENVATTVWHESQTCRARPG